MPPEKFCSWPVGGVIQHHQLCAGEGQKGYITDGPASLFSDTVDRQVLSIRT
jgi:hypothetical protein